MIGIDFHTAKIDIREDFSLSEDNIKSIYQNSQNNNLIEGITILTTCNRTEIYISSNEYLDKAQLIKIFKKSSKINDLKLDQYCYIKREDELVYYLFELTCGLHSMILGEDQIIAQVGDAINLSMEEKASDSILNTLFRNAVTCAKKAKFQVNINNISPSIVSSAIDLAKEYLSLDESLKVLVIGNGEIGRLAARLFLDEGCNVTMTKRNYKYSEVKIPKGCKTIAYEERLEIMPEVDVVVSATKSPHYTISYNKIKDLSRLPDYIFDLAMPRDIDPQIKSIKSIKYFDVDDIGSSTTYYDMEKIEEIKEIIEKYYKEFNRWLLIRNSLQVKGAVEC